ncbi:MAG: DUF2017 family protein [Propionibacteriaceae bacterium]|nr:DUF2017 family protein [Propionibacteriaceae bacterium]
MKGVSRTPEGRLVVFHPGERDVLTQLVAGLVQIVSALLPEEDDAMASLVGVPVSAEEIAGRDPALRRLFPSAYPDDEEADAEYRRFTESDAARAKVEAAVVMWRDLSGSGQVIVPDAHLEAWLKTLTAIRLVLSERDDPELEDIHEWVGWVQESLLQAAD